MSVFQKSDWAIGIVNEVFAEFAHSPLAGMPVAVAELKKVGIESRPEVAYILKRSIFADIPELNLVNTLELF